jgi:hypothetical protein
MKTMSCKQLGGACDQLFSAHSFNEISALSQSHGKQMFEDADEKHLQAMSIMSELMRDPIKMKSWFDDKETEFNALPED